MTGQRSGTAWPALPSHPTGQGRTRVHHDDSGSAPAPGPPVEGGVRGVPVTDSERILARIAAGGADDESMAQRLCEQCVRELPITGAGLALITDQGHVGVLAATDGPARLLEDLQFSLGEGPCLDASREARPVLLPRLGESTAARWPGLGPAVPEAEIGAIFAFPLQVGAIRLGILDLYRAESGSLEAPALKQALAYADAALAVLLHLQGQMAAGDGLNPQLGQVLDRRAEIHQATGVVSVQAAVTLTKRCSCCGRAPSASSDQS